MSEHLLLIRWYTHSPFSFSRFPLLLRQGEYSLCGVSFASAFRVSRHRETSAGERERDLNAFSLVDTLIKQKSNFFSCSPSPPFDFGFSFSPFVVRRPSSNGTVSQELLSLFVCNVRYSYTDFPAGDRECHTLLSHIHSCSLSLFTPRKTGSQTDHTRDRHQNSNSINSQSVSHSYTHTHAGRGNCFLLLLTKKSCKCV